MMKKTFSKTLSANDVGITGAHQAGIHVPKSEKELLAFLPFLDPNIKNPDAWIECVDEEGVIRQFRFIYYNNRLHDIKGTRNEYRITHMTKYFREMGAREGQIFEISKIENEPRYTIRIYGQTQKLMISEQENVYRIKISTSWRRVH